MTSHSNAFNEGATDKTKGSRFLKLDASLFDQGPQIRAETDAKINRLAEGIKASAGHFKGRKLTLHIE